MWFNKEKSFSIGVDMADNTLKAVQLSDEGAGIKLHAGSCKNRPEYIEPGSGQWQRWTIDSLKEMHSNCKFKGKKVIAAVPASEVFIDTLKMPKVEKDKLEQALLAKLKQKLPFDSADAMLKYFEADEDNVVVIAMDRKKIDRFLAIYEKANMELKSLAVWPMALTRSYTAFFGRRETDKNSVAMLIDTESNLTNMVITRHNNILYARSIAIGIKQFNNPEMVKRLIVELNACKRQYASLYHKAQIERLIFMCGQPADNSAAIHIAIAKQLELPAQMGDCLSAVQTGQPYSGALAGIDRRDCKFSWATAFGLSLL